MCLAIPGKIERVNKNSVVVDYGGQKRKVRGALVKVKKGDWVIVRNNFIVVKLNRPQAKEILKLIKK